MAEEVLEEDVLRRYVNPLYFNDDGTLNSQAFQTVDMSVDLCRLRTLKESIEASKEGWGQSEFPVKTVLSIGLSVVHSPVEGSEQQAANPAHCHIPGKTTRSQAKRIRDAAVFVFRPETSSLGQ